MNPVRATGVVFEAQCSQPPTIGGVRGTCFAFRHPTHLLTAAHCVADLSPEEIGIVLQTKTDRLRGPVEVVRHPEADLALIRLEALEEDAGTDAFWNWLRPSAEDFMAFGYPIDVLGPMQKQPTARLFKGHFQRFIDPYRPDGSSYRYLAGEMSIAAPVGLSGGPVFRAAAPSMLLGMVTANLSSSTGAEEESVEERLNDGSIKTTIYRHVVNYGVALMVDSVQEWLDGYVPPRERGGS